jgi:lipopolysaccharide/colanic/teichoic acid biosynthesis glycosyltransferase
LNPLEQKLVESDANVLDCAVGGVSEHQSEATPAGSLSHHTTPWLESLLRRGLDVTSAAIGLICLLPLFVLIGLAIKMEDGGAIFYLHPRVGRNFSRFGLLKFRTMIPNADRIGGPVTVAGDTRVTRVGRFLRKYKLDELPQLLNVLRGQISLVGPRPESERYVAMFHAQYVPILLHRPGITDPATVAFRDEESLLQGGDTETLYTKEILPRKLELSARYLEQRTFFSDVKIILQTLFRIVKAPEA